MSCYLSPAPGQITSFWTHFLTGRKGQLLDAYHLRQAVTWDPVALRLVLHMEARQSYDWLKWLNRLLGPACVFKVGSPGCPCVWGVGREEGQVTSSMNCTAQEWHDPIMCKAVEGGWQPGRLYQAWQPFVKEGYLGLPQKHT
jgi:hypothetical protein